MLLAAFEAVLKPLMALTSNEKQHFPENNRFPFIFHFTQTPNSASRCK